jgi:hypothetical protein
MDPLPRFGSSNDELTSPLWTRPAPSLCYLRADDNVRVTAYNALASVRLVINSRVLTGTSGVEDAGDTLVPATNRTASTVVVRTPEGWLLGGEVFVQSAAPLEGQAYVVVEVIRGESSAAQASQVLAFGYVTAKQPLTWPGPRLQGFLEGGGALRSITGTTPGVGVEVSETVPTGARWELISFMATLVTSATVANRVPSLVLDDGANVFARPSILVNETASTTWPNNWGQGYTAASTSLGGAVMSPLPVNVRLPSGGRIRTITAALQAGDQWNAVQYLVREWIEGS